MKKRLISARTALCGILSATILFSASVSASVEGTVAGFDPEAASAALTAKAEAEAAAPAASTEPATEAQSYYYGGPSTVVNGDGTFDLSSLYSHNAVLEKLDGGEILAAQSSDERIYPASMTKIMTAMLVVENIPDLDTQITMSQDVFDLLNQVEPDASVAGFWPYETVTVRDLLYGILLPSGAECCLQLAAYIAGSSDAFVDMMNQRAQELGMNNTHFVTCTGLHNDDHYTTCEDIALLLRTALTYDNFRIPFCTASYTAPATSQHPEGLTFRSTMFQYMTSSEVTGGQILGGKTGYTSQAGQCLASYAEVNGTQYILVTAGTDGNHQTEQFHILDAQNVYSGIGEIGL